MLKPEDKPLCAEVDPELFFPDPSRDRALQAQAIKDGVFALSICAACPIEQACLEFALQDRDTVNWGIYGGTLPFERISMTNFGRVTTEHFASQHATRKQATKQGIPTPTIGASRLKTLRRRAW